MAKPLIDVSVSVELGADFEDSVIAAAMEGLAEMEIDYECPECGSPMKVRIGERRACGACGFTVTAVMG